MNNVLLKSKRLCYLRYEVLSKFGFGKKWWLLGILFSFHKIKKTFVNWYDFIQDCFGSVQGKKIIYRTYSQISIIARPRTIDVGIIDEIFVKNIYGSYKDFFNKNDIVLDVGAHIGVFSLYVSKYLKDGTIYALEPDKENFNQLRKNIKLNKNFIIKACNIGLSNHTGNSNLNISLENNAAHSFHFGKSNLSKKVRTKTLADFINEKSISHVKLMKLDCEGSEYEILYSCPRKLLHTIDVIVMELHEMDERNCYQSMKIFLKQNGFELSYLHNGGNIVVAWQTEGCKLL